MFNEFKPVLKETKFSYLWASQILSQLTINSLNFLFLVKLFAATRSTVATSFLWIAYALPALLVGPVGSAAVDTVSKRKMLMLATLFESLTVFTYAILHESRVFLIYGAAFTYSFFNQFYIPSEASSVPSLVPKKFLAHANSLFFLTQQASMGAGFALASIFNNLFGFATSLYIASIFPFLALVSVSFLPEMNNHPKMEPQNFEGSVAKFFASIAEGYNFIKGQRKILIPFLFLGALQVAATIVVVTFPAFATEVMRIALSSAAVFIVIPAAAGAVSGVAVASKLLRQGWRKKRLIELSLMLITFSLFVLIFLVPEVTTILRLTLGMLAIALAGFSFAGLIIPTQTYLQEVTPGGLRGRVFGNFWFMATIATVFPVIFSGTITDILGIRMLLAMLFAFSLAVLVYSKKKGDAFLENGEQF